jgi:aryl-alcohol dehydrogenase-like predicted oxidoreductase
MNTKSHLPGGTWQLGTSTVSRFGYGAMQLAGPWVMGPPADRDAALTVLREAVQHGITHIDTSEAYGPHVTNALIREALHPYPDSVTIATKVGARRDASGGWPTARTPADIRAQVTENLETLGVDRLAVVNLRMGDAEGPQPGSLEEPFEALVEMQLEGLIGHIGVSNVTSEQVDQARSIAPIVCVQNLYNLAHRADDDLIDRLAVDDIAYVPFFPLGGFTPLQSASLSAVSDRLHTTPMSVALGWLLQRSSNILLIPGTSNPEHLRENIAGTAVQLGEDDLEELNGIGA